MEGLNYVPMLTQNTTPPSSGRSRISLNRKRSRRSIIYYNGNYEGDNSMFRGQGFELERLSLVDTESDTDLKTETASCSSFKAKKEYEKASIAWRLLQFFMVTFFKPELREKITTRMENFTKSSVYQRFSKWAKKSTIFFTFTLYLAAILCTHFAALWRLFWRRRVIFHNLVRRLLWRLTLAKCSDLSLFVLILLSIPVLFILSSIGCIISFCGCLKDALNNWRHIAYKIKLL